MDRRDIGSWLQGPKATLEQQGIDFGYPGERLGYPQSGPGSLTSMGRRLIALLVDWATAGILANAFASQWTPSSLALLHLEIFLVQVLVFTVLLGASFGQQILGIQVQHLLGGRASIGQILIRTFLIALVIPAAIWDRDGRGLHDRLSNTAVVRRK